MKDKEAIKRAKFLCSIDTYLEKEMLTSLLNIIKSQEQEIEELKETLKCTQNSWYEDTKVIEKQQKEIEELKEDLNKKPIFLIKDLYNRKLKEISLQDVNGLIEQGREEMKNKIKSEIEELKLECENCSFQGELCDELTTNNNCVPGMTILILQSLLEKEFPTTITKEELEKRWKE